MTPEERAEHTTQWFDMLFEPEDLFEMRAKVGNEKSPAISFLHKRQIGLFISKYLPMHDRRRANVWVGVCPRERKGSTVPAGGRVLWIDLNEDVVDESMLLVALEDSGLPWPTMTVWSGHGYHVYWKLDRMYSPDEIKLRTRRIYELLPADATYDPTRVMRVPGTYNYKDPENPELCHIVEYTGEVFSLDVFPQAEPDSHVLDREINVPSQKIPLLESDKVKLRGVWQKGHLHYLIMGLAGVLRKDLGYSLDEAMVEIAEIQRSVGFEVNSDLEQPVHTTYKAPIEKVAGKSVLADFGIMLDTTKSKNLLKWQQVPNSTARKPKISLIDFSEDLEPQEWWIPGLVGKGTLTMWVAPPKTGKSFGVMQIGHALAFEDRIWDMPVLANKRVLYFQGELAQGMVADRAKAMFPVEHLMDQERFAMTDKPAEFISLVETPEILYDYAEGYDVIIIDPISVFNTNDENSSGSVTQTVAIFDPLIAKGKAVILVHHTNKLQEDAKGNPLPPTMNNIRGSGAWYARADAVALHYRMGGDTDDTRVKFSFRGYPDRDPLTLYRTASGKFTHDAHEHLQNLKGKPMKLRVAGERDLN